VFTYCKDDGSCTSWLDHVLCSKNLDDIISNIFVQQQYISSDHRRLTVTLSDVCFDPGYVNDVNIKQHFKKFDWSKVNVNMYIYSLDKLLSENNIPKCLLGCDQNCEVSEHTMAIDQYYMALISCINQVTEVCAPQANSQGRNFNVPGWSDLVKDKHDVARKAFLD